MRTHDFVSGGFLALIATCVMLLWLSFALGVWLGTLGVPHG